MSMEELKAHGRYVRGSHLTADQVHKCWVNLPVHATSVCSATMAGEVVEQNMLNCNWQVAEKVLNSSQRSLEST